MNNNAASKCTIVNRMRKYYICNAEFYGPVRLHPVKQDYAETGKAALPGRPILMFMTLNKP